jgi:hypothetical protein
MVVTLDAIFSHNDMIGSKIIANGTKHLAKRQAPCSHTALLVNKRWVHESTMKSGVRVISYDAWSTVNTEVARAELKPRSYQEIADLFRDIKGRGYDWLGITFFTLAIIPTFVGFKLPKKNLLQDKNKYFCCEVLGYLTRRCYSMMSPVQIAKELCSGS